MINGLNVLKKLTIVEKNHYFNTLVGFLWKRDQLESMKQKIRYKFESPKVSHDLVT